MPIQQRRTAKRFMLDGLALGHLRPVVGKVFQGLDQYVEAAKFVEQSLATGKVALRI